ncbi:hypothetical protein B5S31_g3042 [[Candida] boidinii]|nr:hypothetical protein B5S31_g3042 [[Candida] boidinii]GMF03574.1 unnamed protein product [[Candida] boidinii]
MKFSAIFATTALFLSTSMAAPISSGEVSNSTDLEIASDISNSTIVYSGASNSTNSTIIYGASNQTNVPIYSVKGTDGILYYVIPAGLYQTETVNVNGKSVQNKSLAGAVAGIGAVAGNFNNL